MLRSHAQYLNRTRQDENKKDTELLRVTSTAMVETYTRCSNREDRMSVWWMPRRRVPKKDVATLRKAWGNREQVMIPRSPNGATQPKGYRVKRREPGELKHLRYPEEKKVFP